MSWLPHLILIGFNLVNAIIDAYRIKGLNKAIAHGINFGAYALLTGMCIWWFKMHTAYAVVFCLSAFFNRQTSFDIPLNLRRGLAWDYVSLAHPPKALMDRIEIWLFGRNNGREIAIFYACMWSITLVLQHFV